MMPSTKEYRKKEEANVVRQEEIDTGVFSLWLKTETARNAKPGQFLNVFLKDGAHILGRPISICDIDTNLLRIVYQVKGFGTKELSHLQAGDKISFIGPLGNGFPTQTSGKAVLIGGGMGVAPLLALAKTIRPDYTILGYRDSVFLAEEFLEHSKKVLISTESGVSGIKGNVSDILLSETLDVETAFVCGPKPMMSAVWKILKARGIDTYVSMEERMACGIGVCLGCVVNSNGEKRCVCKDGPVFIAGEVEL